MDLRTNVKVSGINSLTDARFFSGAGVQLVGFNFDKNSSRYIPTEKVFQIKEWLAFPELVAEFPASSTVDEINNILSKIDLDFVELGDGFPQGSISQIERPVYQRITIEHLSDLSDLSELFSGYDEKVLAFILDFKTHGFEWNVIEQDSSSIETLKSLSEQFNILLDINVTTDNVERIVDESGIEGILLQAGDEIKTGVQSFEEVGDILELLED